jgi:lysine 2,3-aminomutase
MNNSQSVSKKKIIELSNLSEKEFTEICKKYPVRIPNYYFSLIQEKDDGIYKQCVPSLEEIAQDSCLEDPLYEDSDKQKKDVPSLITHRYPDRVLFRISNSCEMYCRFCTRKRKVGDENKNPSKKEISSAINYIKEKKEIRDVLLSGGDPLILPIYELEETISKIYPIISKRDGIIRIGTRIPCVFPEGINSELCNMLKRYHPVYMNIHFNHPREITEESKAACNRLADAGIPLGSQTVLLKGVNDSPDVMKKLMQKLVSIRVKPYYLYQCDPVKGANHFRTKVEKGIEIIKEIRGYTSGLCVPHFVIDAPGGGGKTPLLPEYVKEINDKKVILTNYEGKLFEYHQVN